MPNHSWQSDFTHYLWTDTAPSHPRRSSLGSTTAPATPSTPAPLAGAPDTARGDSPRNYSLTQRRARSGRFGLSRLKGSGGVLLSECPSVIAPKYPTELLEGRQLRDCQMHRLPGTEYDPVCRWTRPGRRLLRRTWAALASGPRRPFPPSPVGGCPHPKHCVHLHSPDAPKGPIGWCMLWPSRRLHISGFLPPSTRSWDSCLWRSEGPRP